MDQTIILLLVILIVVVFIILEIFLKGIFPALVADGKDFVLSFLDEVLGIGVVGGDIGDFIAALNNFFVMKEKVGEGWALIASWEQTGFTPINFIPGVGETTEIFNVVPTSAIIQFMFSKYGQSVEAETYLKEKIMYAKNSTNVNIGKWENEHKEIHKLLYEKEKWVTALRKSRNANKEITLAIIDDYTSQFQKKISKIEIDIPDDIPKRESDRISEEFQPVGVLIKNAVTTLDSAKSLIQRTNFNKQIYETQLNIIQETVNKACVAVGITIEQIQQEVEQEEEQIAVEKTAKLDQAAAQQTVKEPKKKEGVFSRIKSFVQSNIGKASSEVKTEAELRELANQKSVESMITGDVVSRVVNGQTTVKQEIGKAALREIKNKTRAKIDEAFKKRKRPPQQGTAFQGAT